MAVQGKTEKKLKPLPRRPGQAKPGDNSMRPDPDRRTGPLPRRPDQALKKEHYDWRSTLDEKCWDGYEKKGMKTMFGKRYPNCVKKSKKKK